MKCVLNFFILLLTWTNGIPEEYISKTFLHSKSQSENNMDNDNLQQKTIAALNELQREDYARDNDEAGNVKKYNIFSAKKLPEVTIKIWSSYKTNGLEMDDDGTVPINRFYPKGYNMPYMWYPLPFYGDVNMQFPIENNEDYYLTEYPESRRKPRSNFYDMIDELDHEAMINNILPGNPGLETRTSDQGLGRSVSYSSGDEVFAEFPRSIISQPMPLLVSCSPHVERGAGSRIKIDPGFY